MRYIRNTVLILVLIVLIILFGQFGLITLIAGFILNFIYDAYKTYTDPEYRQHDYNRINKNVAALFTNNTKKSSTVDPFKPLNNKHKLQLFKLNKQAYLASAAWNTKRKQVLKNYHYSCAKCGSCEPLAVHHMSGYNLMPNEPLSCLIPLCEHCHTEEHTFHGYPKTYQDYMTWNHPIRSV